MPEIRPPGLYVVETHAPHAAVVGLPSSICAFIGATADGPVGEAKRIHDPVDFTRIFGAAAPGLTLPRAVADFFAQGGKIAWVLRVAGDSVDDADIVAALPGLDAAEHLNLLVIPPPAPERDIAPATWAAAAQYCRQRRALLIIDAPAAWDSAPDLIQAAAKESAALRQLIDVDALAHAALYFPRIGQDRMAPDCAPSGGAVAGVIARQDVRRGLWVSPAGLTADLNGVRRLGRKLSDEEGRTLNQQAINCLRFFPPDKFVVFGARTLAGAEGGDFGRVSSDWRYIPVARLAWHIENSLAHGLRWAAFEPNDARTRGRMRIAAEDFLTSLFRLGAFQGQTPRDSFFATCDDSTTTTADIAAGRINLEIGFAPLKPAEFIVLRVPVRVNPR